MPGERLNVEREIVVPEEPDEVWESLTDPRRLEEGFASDVELDARPGGEGVFRWGDGDERRGERRPRPSSGPGYRSRGRPSRSSSPRWRRRACCRRRAPGARRATR